MKRLEDPERDPASEARDDHASEPCKHAAGYWIKRGETFRCYRCQCQLRLSEIAPRRRKIETWRAR